MKATIRTAARRVRKTLRRLPKRCPPKDGLPGVFMSTLKVLLNMLKPATKDGI
jgi:hypothetical protein